MRPLRIAFLDSWLEQAVDGSGTAVAIGGLARTLRHRGHTIERIVPTGNWPSNLTLRRLWYNWRLPERLQPTDYDLIVGFDIDGVRWANQGQHPHYICSIKGVLAEEASHERGLIHWLLWGLSRLERLNARRAGLIITTSNYCADAIQRHYGVLRERIAVVPEGIDLTLWKGLNTSRREPATVLCVARQYPRKHVADLIDAWPLVRQRVPDARLVIIGDGPEHDALQQRAFVQRDSIHLLGGVTSDVQVREWYARSTVFCLPSIQEGFGIVFLEAMAAGLPIVSTNSAAIPEVVPHGIVGTLVNPSDPSALAAALIDLLCDPLKRATYATAAREYVQRYDWERVTDRFLAVAHGKN